MHLWSLVFISKGFPTLWRRIKGRRKDVRSTPLPISRQLKWRTVKWLYDSNERFRGQQRERVTPFLPLTTGRSCLTHNLGASVFLTEFSGSGPPSVPILGLIGRGWSPLGWILESLKHLPQNTNIWAQGPYTYFCPRVYDMVWVAYSLYGTSRTHVCGRRMPELDWYHGPGRHWGWK